MLLLLSMSWWCGGSFRAYKFRFTSSEDEPVSRLLVCSLSDFSTLVVFLFCIFLAVVCFFHFCLFVVRLLIVCLFVCLFVCLLTCLLVCLWS